MEYIVYRSQGKLLYDNGKYNDQLDPNDDVWFSDRTTSSYLNKKYNLTPQLYYNIVVYNDINYRHKCENPDCNNYTEFNRFNRGYNHTCCRSCSNFKKLLNKDYYDTLVDNLSRGTYKQYYDPETKDEYAKLRHDHITELNNTRVLEGTHNFLSINRGSKSSSTCNKGR